jgi:tetratricopeptide (TPR) repeat protein
MEFKALVLSANCLLIVVGCSRSVTLPTTAASATRAATPVASDGHQSVRLPTTITEWAHGAMLFAGLGNVHRTITTRSPEAQRYFDQGLSLMWAFNHDEATRSFAKAAEFDPACASCFWGVSLTVGPNYNLPFLSEQRAKIAYEALLQAEQNAHGAAPVEQALIAALAKRYPTARPLDPTSAIPILAAYADAMKDVAQRFPEDLDVQTLYAESMMNINAWKLWSSDGKPAAGTDHIVAMLESVLARDPRHLGANHYYVHAVEASPHPEKGLVAAERLEGLAPAAGHLVHMPAHILQRIGQYEDAADANRKAALADAAYVARTHPPDYYPVMYTAHNYQFLAYSAAAEGRKAETIAAVDNSRRAVSDEMLLEMSGSDWYVAESYAARVRFGLWEEMLALPAPPSKLIGLTAGYLYARAVALAATGRVAESRSTLDELQKLAAAVPADTGAGQNTIKSVLAIAIPIVEARIADAEGQSKDVLTLLRQAVAAEDRLAYDEPKNWFFPARHLLGAALLKRGAASEAESVYREDLRQSPANGWSLYGLSVALKTQGKATEAAQVANQFAESWRYSDVTLTASAF